MVIDATNINGVDSGLWKKADAINPARSKDRKDKANSLD